MENDRVVRKASLYQKLRSEGSRQWPGKELVVWGWRRVLEGEENRGSEKYSEVLCKESTHMFQELSDNQCGQSYLEKELEETRLSWYPKVLTYGRLSMNVRCMYRWMDGYNVSMSWWLDRWINEWMDGWLVGWLDKLMNRWIAGYISEWMDSWMDRRVHVVCIVYSCFSAKKAELNRDPTDYKA